MKGIEKLYIHVVIFSDLKAAIENGNRKRFWKLTEKKQAKQDKQGVEEEFMKKSRLWKESRIDIHICRFN